jgi:tetratricopeptide (TPR) repeat protein
MGKRRLPIPRLQIAGFPLLFVLAVGQFPPQVPPPPTRPPARPPGTQPDPAPPRPRPDRPRVRSATGDALDRYVQGDYAAAIEFLQQLGGFNVLLAQEWIQAKGSVAADRRRLAAATMVLEYTAARPNLSPPLIEWACEQLAKYPTPGLEELWLRASIALIEGRQAWTILTGATSSHLAHARARFPDNPHFKLAEGVSAEATANDASGSPASRGLVIDRLWAEMLDTPADAKTTAAALLQQAATSLEGLVVDDTVGAEARLRLGFIHLRLGRREQALQQFKQIETAQDPALKYLGRLFSGWTLARDGRTDEAIAAYRAALDVIPRVRSATTLLTMLLVMNHKLDEAEKVADAFMTGASTTEDPWRTYPLGSYRSYQGLIDRLREAIR